MASNLAPSELYKQGREDRIVIFLNKYEKREEFELVASLSGKKKVVLIFDKEIYKRLKNKINPGGIEFQTNLGKSIKLSALAKTSEFGGMADKKISTTHIEEKEIISIRQQLIEIKKKTKKSTVPIKVKSTIYDVYDISKTPGTPKSDFHFLDITGKEIIWMSHKDGSKATDFQQWGGISKNVPNTHNHKETKEFLKELKDNFKTGLPPASNVVKNIKDNVLKNKSVYGDNFKQGSRQYNRDNVHLVLQGPVKIIKKSSYYEIDANHIHTNGEILKGEYEPTFTAQYRSDRNDPIPHSRSSIWPKVVEKRKNTIFLNPKKK
jgi:hypothetical protein